MTKYEKGRMNSTSCTILCGKCNKNIYNEEYTFENNLPVCSSCKSLVQKSTVIKNMEVSKMPETLKEKNEMIADEVIAHMDEKYSDTSDMHKRRIAGYMCSKLNARLAKKEKGKSKK